MERFVFVAAVTFAIIFGLVAMVSGGDGLHFEMGNAKLVTVAPGRMPAQSFAGDELVIKYTAAHIVIIPEDRSDFSVEIENPGHAPMPLVEIEEGDVRIDGQLRGRVDSCREGGGAELDGYGEFALADLPQITIRTPRTLHVSLGKGSTTEIGPTEALELDFLGCGTVTAGDVAGELTVEIAGSGAVNAGATRRLSAELLGSGDLNVGAVAERSEIEVAGNGNVTIAALTGELRSDSAGSGDLTIQGGAITSANIDMAGSGNASITAPIERLTVAIAGSGDVQIEGIVGDLEADIAGSGSVTARAVTGTITKDVLGSGEVIVSGR
jgi:Putative auto-transporter adhesin, head GIN domain